MKILTNKFKVGDLVDYGGISYVVVALSKDFPNRYPDVTQPWAELRNKITGEYCTRFEFVLTFINKEDAINAKIRYLDQKFHQHRRKFIGKWQR